MIYKIVKIILRFTPTLRESQIIFNILRLSNISLFYKIGSAENRFNAFYPILLYSSKCTEAHIFV